MLNILTIIGARPQIIKAAALSRAIRNGFAGCITEKILHTGQHYDSNMSQVFFDELGIPQPDYNLHVGSGSHAVQTAKMLACIEQVLQTEHFDALVVYGDTNSTLAGAVAACKLHVPVVHIEAGLRSFNMTMPEEQNRMVCDQLSSLLFAPTETAMENLRQEGFMDSKATFAGGKHREIWQCGDIMFDNSLYFASVAEKKTTVLRDHSLQHEQYLLATIHRDSNTDSPQRLTAIFKALLQLSAEETVVLPLHPRTAKLLETNLEKDVYTQLRQSGIRIIPPVSFLEMTALEQHARMVLTDSGGVQKEAFFFARPCVIMRPETEWIEIVEQGAGLIADADTDRIVNAYNLLKNRKLNIKPVFGDGRASTWIAKKIVAYL
ncbi:MAG: UDP-N-acetylglucosamine 2-epimerase (non-hydrolyzing) [Bacteroidales bacterium]|nr:UDP-N-acetylglucosamine 2-epimerase (non-hydrolyzing) [Bacteroidales bacterium]